MSSSGQAMVARGLDHHRRNQLDEAERLYAAALVIDPNDPQALHLSGVLAQQRGHFSRSVDLIERSIQIRPDPHFVSNLANAYNQLGRWAQAERASRRAIELDSKIAAAHCNLGVAQQSDGQAAEAAQSFREAIRLQPDYADAYSNLGVVLTTLGDLDNAERALRRAMSCGSPSAETWFNLGNVLLRRQSWPKAVDAYRQALTLRPDFTEAAANLGAAYKAIGAGEQSVAAYAQAARLAPASALAQHNLALVLREHGRDGDAAAAFERAATLHPGNPAYWLDLGGALNGLAKGRQDASALPLLDQAIDAYRAAIATGVEAAAAHASLGVILSDRGLFEQAEEEFRRALDLAPDSAEAACNLGHCLVEMGRFDQAIATCEQALRLNPELAEAHATLGNALTGLNRLETAEMAYRRALALSSDLAGGHCNLGVALFRKGDVDGAIIAYDRALSLKPDLADARWNRGLARLQLGDFAQGWEDYEWRLRRAARVRRDKHLTRPLWAGDPLEGRSILLHAEQGLGDAIQCARFIPGVAARGGDTVVLVPRSLMDLFRQVEGIGRLVPDDEPPPETTCRLPLFSLPRLFGASIESLAPGAPYLRADPARVEIWAQRLRAGWPDARLRIGVVWSGNLTAEVELGRSIPLRAFAPLGELPGIRLISLQKAHGLDQLDDETLPIAVGQLGRDYDRGSFADTAAVIQALDLVVSCDTSVAHLAGAIGRPIWLAVNAVADWRWLLGRTDSPWYRSLRLFRQPRPGDWSSTFQQMAYELSEHWLPDATDRRSTPL